jgi:hypothetical protein
MILLISDTPVAGTVDRLATWIEKLSGQKTIPLIKRNYPHHAFELTGGTFGCMPNWEDYISLMVKQASCIILHNVLDETVLNLVFKDKARGANLIYQLHSPPLEGPQFTYNILSKYKFDAVFSVSQGHGRFVKGTIPVPNIVKDFTIHGAPKKQDLVFVPHIRTTNFKWSNKFSNLNAKELNENKKLFKGTKIATIKSLFGRDVVSHPEIQFALQFCSFVVDDVNTGLIHQTAIEGLKAGCGVFSAADLYSTEEYSNAIEAPAPPFIYVNNMEDIVKFLISTSSTDYLRDKGEVIRSYSEKYLGEERLAKMYLRELATYLGN